MVEIMSQTNGTSNNLFLSHFAHRIADLIKLVGDLDSVEIASHISAFDASSATVTIMTTTRDRLAISEIGKKSFVKATITVFEHEIVCVDYDFGVKSINLQNPNACDKLIEWMVLTKLVDHETKWDDSETCIG